MKRRTSSGGSTYFILRPMLKMASQMLLFGNHHRRFMLLLCPPPGKRFQEFLARPPMLPAFVGIACSGHAETGLVDAEQGRNIGVAQACFPRRRIWIGEEFRACSGIRVELCEVDFQWVRIHAATSICAPRLIARPRRNATRAASSCLSRLAKSG